MPHPDGLAFAELKRLCDLTDGNLSRHLQVLQEAGLVAITKGYDGNRPHTTCRMTRAGRRRLIEARGLRIMSARRADAAAPGLPERSFHAEQEPGFR